MISDAERREVARRLRDAEERTLLALTDGELLDELAEAVGFDNCREAGYEDGLFKLIADLIDRPTGHDDDEQEQPPVYTDWFFKCSYCGWDGQIWKSVGPDDMSLCETNYCPNCGEAVLE